MLISSYRPPRLRLDSSHVLRAVNRLYIMLLKSGSFWLVIVRRENVIGSTMLC